MNTASKPHPLPNLRERRLAVEISAERLARLVDTTMTTVYRIEHGWKPSQNLADRINAALAVLEAERDAA